jgi:hypothetical protein
VIESLPLVATAAAVATSFHSGRGITMNNSGTKDRHHTVSLAKHEKQAAFLPNGWFIFSPERTESERDTV